MAKIATAVLEKTLLISYLIDWNPELKNIEKNDILNFFHFHDIVIFNTQAVYNTCAIKNHWLIVKKLLETDECRTLVSES